MVEQAVGGGGVALGVAGAAVVGAVAEDRAQRAVDVVDREAEPVAAALGVRGARPADRVADCSTRVLNNLLIPTLNLILLTDVSTA